MENRPDSPPWGKGLVVRPIGTPLSQGGVVYQPSEATSQHLHELATENGVSDIEFVKLGLALAEILTTAKREGNRLAVVDGDGKVVHELIGA
jgi:hypothetical protein